MDPTPAPDAPFIDIYDWFYEHAKYKLGMSQDDAEEYAETKAAGYAA